MIDMIKTMNAVYGPEAYVSVSKNRQKVYKKDNTDIVYLSDKTEFQLELFNPESFNVMLKISMNGNDIYPSGFMLRPGQRVWLERYVDVARKFIFETYTIPENDAYALKAIEKNGNITIQFFREKQNFWGYPYTTYTTYTQYINTPLYDNIGTGCSPDITFNNTTGEIKSENFTCYSSTNTLKSSVENKELETGRIEKGSNSDQKFDSVNMDFESISYKCISYKILPSSSKPLEVSDMKKFCAACGKKIKKDTFKFCPYCGTELS